MPCQWFSRLASALDRRSAHRLALLLLGSVLARGRRTVTSWIRAAGLSGHLQHGYTAVAAAGKKAETIAAYLVLTLVEPLLGGVERLTIALDDTPPPRYGPHVQGAGVHHNPTPGPAGSPYVYGHVFVVLGLLVIHQAWGVIALPLLARLYVRKKDLPGINAKHRPAFWTKLEMGVELLRWAKKWLGLLKKPIWVVGRTPRRTHLSGPGKYRTRRRTESDSVMMNARPIEGGSDHRTLPCKTSDPKPGYDEVVRKK